MQGYPLLAGEPRAIPLNNTLLPEYLQKLGYSTHLVGKWHVGYYSSNHTPSNRGFDTFYGYYNGYVTYFNHTIEGNLHIGYDLHHDVSGKLSVDYNYEYLTDLITDKAENIIAKHDPRKPLYLQMAHVAVHSSNSEEVMEVRNMTEVNSTLGYIKDFNRRKFAGVMTALDESVGKVTEALRKANLLQNSIIVFMTDNGAQTEGYLVNYGSNYPLRGLKTTQFEGAVRGTACIYSPLIKKSSRISNELIHVSDWLPTFYSAAGGNLEDLEENLDGIDQWSSIVSEKKTNRSGVLLNINEVSKLSGALVGKYKLIKGVNLEYGDYYGYSGTDESYPEYNTSSVLQSLAGSAIAAISKTKLATKDIVKLRDEARVVCKNVIVYPKCLDKCLFDVYSDPCETTDLSFAYPEVVEELNNYINDYNKVLMHQTNKPMDPASLPEHFNGTWMPWINLRSDYDSLLHFL